MSEATDKTFASGRYVAQRLLGQGAQKIVYLVDDTTLGRQCAVSVLNAALFEQSDIDRIRREAQTMAGFGTQPHIVTVYDYGEEDGSPFVVCEYVPGGELRAELSSAGRDAPLGWISTPTNDEHGERRGHYPLDLAIWPEAGRRIAARTDVRATWLDWHGTDSG